MSFLELFGPIYSLKKNPLGQKLKRYSNVNIFIKTNHLLLRTIHYSSMTQLSLALRFKTLHYLAQNVAGRGDMVPIGALEKITHLVQRGRASHEKKKTR